MTLQREGEGDNVLELCINTKDTYRYKYAQMLTCVFSRASAHGIHTFTRGSLLKK